MSENTEQPTAESKTDIILDNDKQLVAYANMITLSANLEDGFIHFGQRTNDSATTADGVAKVYLSIPAIKRLSLALRQLVETLDAANGAEIDMDPNKALNLPEAKERIGEVRKLQAARDGRVNVNESRTTN